MTAGGDLFCLIVDELTTIVAEKGETLPVLTADSAFLGGGLPVDSLDLATLLVVLESRLGVDPFRAGFRQFTTVGELSSLYEEALAARTT